MQGEKSEQRTGRSAQDIERVVGSYGVSSDAAGGGAGCGEVAWPAEGSAGVDQCVDQPTETGRTADSDLGRQIER